MTLLTASLFLLCLLGLTGSAAFMLLQRSPLHRLYALLALSLVGWVATLLLFTSRTSPASLLWVGRLNFAVVAVAATAAFLFVQELAGRKPGSTALLWTETLLLFCATLLTGLVDRAETVRADQHVTAYGVLFPLYLLHIVVLLGAAVFIALRPMPTLSMPTLSSRRALRLVGWGILAAAAVGLVTNALLPSVYGDFHWIAVGPLSTLLFLGAVGYAVFAYHLFSVRLILRKAVVLAGVVTLMLELYQGAVAALARILPVGDASHLHLAATGVALAVNAFTQQSVRKWLEKRIDGLFSRSSKLGNSRHRGNSEPWRQVNHQEAVAVPKSHNATNP